VRYAADTRMPQMDLQYVARQIAAARATRQGGWSSGGVCSVGLAFSRHGVTDNLRDSCVVAERFALPLGHSCFGPNARSNHRDLNPRWLGPVPSEDELVSQRLALFGR